VNKRKVGAQERVVDGTSGVRSGGDVIIVKGKRDYVVVRVIR